MKELKVALCAIGRLENNYVVEFVEYYKKMNFDKIFIYDNNHDGEEYFEEKIQSYIDTCFVDVVDCRNKEKWQLKAYQDCYDKHKNEYDYIAFFDFDEYLVLNDVFENDIKKYLSIPNFADADCIHINWMTFDDNGLICYEDKPLNERFTHPVNFDRPLQYDFPENDHVKSILRGGLNNVIWGNPHTPYSNLRCCNNTGQYDSDDAFCNYNYDLAYIKHFTNKTIEEFLLNKMKRGTGDRSYALFLSTYLVENFFKLNQKTEEKLKYIEEWKKKTEF